MKKEDIKKFTEKLKKISLNDLLQEDIKNELEFLRILLNDVFGIIKVKAKPFII